tara:strand:- start:92 stop:922 length:831 start_codon:yes stop_codon:yes gene_type:complete
MLDTDTNEITYSDNANPTFGSVTTNTINAVSPTDTVNLYNNVTTGYVNILSGLTTGLTRLGSPTAPLYIESSEVKIISGTLSSQDYLASIVNESVNFLTNLIYYITRPIITIGSSQADMVINTHDLNISASTNININNAGYMKIDAGIPLCAPSTVAGVYLLNGSGGSFWSYPITCSCDLNKLNNSNGLTSTLPTSADGGTAVGTFSIVALRNVSDKFLVFPHYGLILYRTNGDYASTKFINYQNNTNQMQVIAPNGGSGEMVQIYFKGVIINSAS